MKPSTDPATPRDGSKGKFQLLVLGTAGLGDRDGAVMSHVGLVASNPIQNIPKNTQGFVLQELHSQRNRGWAQ